MLNDLLRSTDWWAMERRTWLALSGAGVVAVIAVVMGVMEIIAR